MAALYPAVGAKPRRLPALGIDVAVFVEHFGMLDIIDIAVFYKSVDDSNDEYQQYGNAIRQFSSTAEFITYIQGQFNGDIIAALQDEVPKIDDRLDELIAERRVNLGMDDSDDIGPVEDVPFTEFEKDPIGTANRVLLGNSDIVPIKDGLGVTKSVRFSIGSVSGDD